MRFKFILNLPGGVSVLSLSGREKTDHIVPCTSTFLGYVLYRSLVNSDVDANIQVSPLSH